MANKNNIPVYGSNPYYGWNFGDFRGTGIPISGGPQSNQSVLVGNPGLPYADYVRAQNSPPASALAAQTNPMFELGKLQQQFVKGADYLETLDPNPSAPTYVKRPWIDEPPGAQPFDLQNGIPIPAVGGHATVLRLTVFEGSDGVIKYISNNVAQCGFTQFSGDLIWGILINGRAVQSFANILNEKGTIEIPRPISPLRIYSRDIVEYVIFHQANAGIVGETICCFNGYLYPSKGVS